MQVALLAEEAEVEVDPARADGDQVAAWINEIGFHATKRSGGRHEVR